MEHTRLGRGVWHEATVSATTSALRSPAPELPPSLLPHASAQPIPERFVRPRLPRLPSPQTYSDRDDQTNETPVQRAGARTPWADSGRTQSLRPPPHAALSVSPHSVASSESCRSRETLPESCACRGPALTSSETIAHSQ